MNGRCFTAGNVTKNRQVGVFEEQDTSASADGSAPE
jgi:hypothetical protein